VPPCFCSESKRSQGVCKGVVKLPVCNQMRWGWAWPRSKKKSFGCLSWTHLLCQATNTAVQRIFSPGLTKETAIILRTENETTYPSLPASRTSGIQNASHLTGFEFQLEGFREELMPYHKTIYSNKIFARQLYIWLYQRCHSTKLLAKPRFFLTAANDMYNY
jgi:hypothetical protein